MEIVNLSDPMSSVLPGALGTVLGELSRATRAVSASELAALLVGRVGKSRVYELLEDLTLSGLVVLERDSGPKLYVLNRKHLAAVAVSELANLRENLIEKIAAAIKAWEVQPFSAVLFGSVASGNSKPESDIDLLLITSKDVGADDAWFQQLSNLESEVLAWTGNLLHISSYPLATWNQMLKDEFKITKEIKRSGILLLGKDIQQFS